MNFNPSIKRWKIALVIIGAFIVAASMYYTNYLIEKIEQDEKDEIERFLLAQQNIGSESDIELTLSRKIISSIKIPLILENSRGGIDIARNFGENLDTNKIFLQKELEKIKKSGLKPFNISSKYFNQTVWYKHSKLYTLLQYYPLVQILMVSAFIFLGFIGFDAIKKSQENKIWVGMAKETAHQLGTPISGMMGWIEYLDSTASEEQKDMVIEMRKDIKRLDLIADRFSKIGSTPKLDKYNIYEIIEQTHQYWSKRAPRKVNFDFPNPHSEPLFVNINSHLFSWVMENLIRNALDALEGKGTISIEISKNKSHVIIDVKDTGKGISSSKIKNIFEPGYSTKKRGWGLGLSLAKRIIETYHIGKIFVKRSIEGKETIFTIELPLKH